MGVILKLFWGYVRVILRLHWVISGLYWGYIGISGKENGNYY